MPIVLTFAFFSIIIPLILGLVRFGMDLILHPFLTLYWLLLRITDFILGFAVLGVLACGVVALLGNPFAMEYNLGAIAIAVGIGILKGLLINPILETLLDYGGLINYLRYRRAPEYVIVEDPQVPLSDRW